MEVLIRVCIALILVACRPTRIDDSDCANPPFKTTVDWYRPPPESLRATPSSQQVPGELITPVAEAKRDKAAIYLGQRDSVALTGMWARELVGASDADNVLESLIEQRKDKLEVFKAHPPAFKDPFRNEAIEQVKREIAEYSRWRRRLNPYLIKAVSLNSEGTGFHATLVGNTLLVDQISAVGRRQVPMIKLPIVAFLPIKPDNIYTSFTTFR